MPTNISARIRCSSGVFRKLQTRENPSDFPHPASPLPGQALQGSAEECLRSNLDIVFSDNRTRETSHGFQSSPQNAANINEKETRPTHKGTFISTLKDCENSILKGGIKLKNTIRLSKPFDQIFQEIHNHKTKFFYEDLKIFPNEQGNDIVEMKKLNDTETVFTIYQIVDSEKVCAIFNLGYQTKIFSITLNIKTNFQEVLKHCLEDYPAHELKINKVYSHSLSKSPTVNNSDDNEEMLHQKINFLMMKFNPIIFTLLEELQKIDEEGLHNLLFYINELHKIKSKKMNLSSADPLPGQALQGSAGVWSLRKTPEDDQISRELYILTENPLTVNIDFVNSTQLTDVQVFEKSVGVFHKLPHRENAASPLPGQSLMESSENSQQKKNRKVLSPPPGFGNLFYPISPNLLNKHPSLESTKKLEIQTSANVRFLNPTSDRTSSNFLNMQISIRDTDPEKNIRSNSPSYIIKSPSGELDIYNEDGNFSDFDDSFYHDLLK
jgi:hypothetical protein